MQPNLDSSVLYKVRGNRGAFQCIRWCVCTRRRSYCDKSSGEGRAGSQESAKAANHPLSTNRSNNTNKDHIVSQKKQLSISNDISCDINDISSNIIQEDVSLNALTVANDNSQIDTVFTEGQSSSKENTTCSTATSLTDVESEDSFFSNLDNNNGINTELQKRQLHKEKEDTYISNSQYLTEANSNVSLLPKKPQKDVLTPIKQQNRIYSSRPTEDFVTLKKLDIESSNCNNQNCTVLQEEQSLTGRNLNDEICNTRSQEDSSTISLVDTVLQPYQSTIGDTNSNLYYKNIIQTYDCSSKEPSNQASVDLTNYNSQTENWFSEKPNNQPSNEANKLIIGKISLELPLLNKDTIHVVPKTQISVKIVSKEERPNLQNSIRLLINGPKHKVDKMLKKVKIIIVGAGASGIAAASKLLQEGINDFVILEANNRIGGRINTVDFGDNVVDLGAQWVHGETGNMVCELASKHDLLGSFCTFFDASKHEFFTINGERIPKEESVEALTIYYNMMKEAPDELSIAEGSFGDYFREKFYQVCAEKTFASYNRLAQFFSWMEKAECSIECSDSLSDVSVKRLADYWECEGDSVQNWKDRGYKTLFDLLMRKIPNGENSLPVMEKVEFRKVVTTIDYSSEENITVTTSDSCKYIASHVIFTASLGVLKKKHSTLFVPSLPPTKKRAIRGLSIGTADKIFMEFPYKWWSEDTVAINLVCLEENKKLFLQKYGEEYRWLCDVFSFYTVDYQPRVLCAWIVGKYARHMETLSDTDVSDGLYRLLRESIGKYYDVVQPTKILRSKWFTNEHFQGSYTFQSMNTEDLNVTPNDLAEPIVVNGKPVILFAGEATHDHYYSTVHGAVETGFREADRLLDFNQRRVNSHL